MAYVISISGIVTGLTPSDVAGTKITIHPFDGSFAESEIIVSSDGIYSWSKDVPLDFLSEGPSDSTDTISVRASKNGYVFYPSGFSIGDWEYRLSYSSADFQISLAQEPDTNTYLLTTSVSLGLGSISPSSGTYKGVTSVTVIATPSSGWEVDSWSIPGDSSSHQREGSVIVVLDSNKNVSVSFKEIESEQESGSLTALVKSGLGRVKIDNGISSINSVSIDILSSNEPHTVTAIPDNGWKFKRWEKYVNNDFSSYVFNIDFLSSYSFSNIYNYEAIFEELDTDPEPEHGSLTASVKSGGGGIAIGTDVSPPVGTGFSNTDRTVSLFASAGPISKTVYARANNGYYFSKWEYWRNGIKENEYSDIYYTSEYIAPNDYRLEAIFEQQQATTYLLKIYAGEGGTTTPTPMPENHTLPSGDVLVTASPESGWVVDYWSIPGDSFSYQGEGSVTVSLTSDKDVSVYFKKTITPTLTTNVPLGNGTISPKSGKYTGDITIEGIPLEGYELDKWIINDVVQTDITSLIFQLSMTEKKRVDVYFRLTDVTYYLLVASVKGGNGVLVAGCNQCAANSLVELEAVPNAGYRVKEWVGTDNDSSLSKINNVSIIDTGKTVTVEFEKIPGLGGPTYSGAGIEPDRRYNDVFYYSSKDINSNIISFVYSQVGGNNIRLHFRINFYSDVYKQNLVYSAFSLFDIKRWFIGPSYVSALGFDGIELSDGDNVNIIYSPEILPTNLREQQRKYDIDGTSVVDNEIPLLCGVKYYLDIQYYRSDSTSFGEIESFTYIYPCIDLDSDFWREDRDSKNWICSGQGKVDLKVTKSTNQSLLPVISSNYFGTFQIAWQEFKNNISQIYIANWQSKNDTLYSSGQGFFDKKKLTSSSNPYILTDQSQNFYILGKTETQLNTYKCPLPVKRILDPDVEKIESVDVLCFPGLDTNLDIGSENIKIRVYEEDASGSLVIDDGNVISVIEKTNVRLDIIGIPGTYAIRLRNQEDDGFGDWININSDNLYEENSNLSAYFVDNNRFLVSWNFYKSNGIKRVCCQILTFYGVTNVFCLPVLINIMELIYKIDFYTDLEMVNKISSKYDGKSVISTNNVSLNNNGEGYIYIKITFNTEEDQGDLSFNVIQQGLNDMYGLLLEKQDGKEGVYVGKFVIKRSDGIFNKDGLSAITINFPNQFTNTSTTYCTEDTLVGGGMLDNYNILPTFTNYPQIRGANDADPEEIFELFSSAKFNRNLDINSLKELYNKNDSQFQFGNPKYFIESNQNK